MGKSQVKFSEIIKVPHGETQSTKLQCVHKKTKPTTFYYSVIKTITL